MLILKTFVNTEEISTIAIQNVQKISDKVYEYRIRVPIGYDAIPIRHIRNNGWIPLIEKVLAIIHKRKPRPTKPRGRRTNPN